MGLDLNKVKSRLAQMQTKAKKNADGSFEKIDFKAIYWKPKIGKQVIRLVPFKTNPSEPCLEVTYHNNIVKKKMLALTNWGDKDPIVAFSNELKKSEDKEERDMGYKLAPKKKYLFQIVERGQEHLGTRLWEASKTTAEAIYGIIADSDYGDILDVNDGRDLTVEGVEDTFNNIKFIKPNILPKPKVSPLGKTEDEINGFLNNQYDPLSLTKRYSYEELKGFLEQALTPEGETNDSNDTQDTPVAETEEVVDDTLPFVEDTNENTDVAEDDTEDTVDSEEVPFEVQVPTVAQSAITKASKRIIAKNNEEIKAAATTVKKPEVKVEKPKSKVTKTTVTTAPVASTTGVSNKDRFSALFPKK
jgi:hypothetical protein